MHSTPLQRYQGAVPPPEVLALLAAIGIPLDPIGVRRGLFPIGREAYGDTTTAASAGDPPSIVAAIAARRDADLASAQALVDAATTENRDLTPEQLAQVTSFTEAATQRDNQIAQVEALEQRTARAAEQRARFTGTTDVQVNRNEEVYRRGGEASFFTDMLRARDGDSDARERLYRNNQAGLERERRDGTTGATSMGSFIPPIWLVGELAARARVGRVLAPLLRDGGFPQTNSITIPRITTGSSVAGQAGDNAAVSETDIVTAQLTRPTVTIAGQQDISQQSVDLSPFPVDQIVFADLEGAYQAELDRQVMRGSGTNELLGLNQVAGINAVTYTDATPTVPELYPKVADGIQQIAAARFAPAQIISMHPRRWAWLTASLDTQNRPLVVPGVSVNTVARFGDIAAQSFVGEMQGVPIVTTGSHATNLGGGTEDQVVIFRPDDVILMESPLRTRIHEQTLNGNLTLRLQLFTYVNLFAGRFPASISTIGGTGLIAPTF